MSYAAEDLGIGILELFTDAAYAAPPPPIRIPINLWRPSPKPRVMPPPRPKLPREELRRREKERRKQMEARVRTLRVAEREENHVKFVLNTEMALMAQLAPKAVKQSHYCSKCHSTTSTHRCPG